MAASNKKTIRLVEIDPKKLGIKKQPFTNIPLINHLQECAEIYRLIHDEEFQRKCRNASPTSPVTALNFDWYSWGDDLLTLLLQRAILGTESFLTGITLQEIVQRGLVSSKTRDFINNPFTLGRGTADVYYNKLPAQVDPIYSLKVADKQLWREVQTFYREARNKVFHGYRLTSRDPAVLHPYFETLRRVFLWMDSWFEDHVGAALTVDIRRYWPDLK